MKILVVEDNAPIRTLLSLTLSKDGHEVREAGSAEEALVLLQKQSFEAFILDVMLPGMSGRELCEYLRHQGNKAPILLLTAQSGLEHKVAGLDAGANDYLTKPFESQELRARVRGFERMLLGYPKPVLTLGSLTFDPNHHKLMTKEGEQELTPKEFAVFDLLLRQQGRVVSAAEIATVVWGSARPLSSNLINVFVNSLRKKLDPGNPFAYIRTVRRKGFTFSVSSTS